MEQINVMSPLEDKYQFLFSSNGGCTKTYLVKLTVQTYPSVWWVLPALLGT